MRGVAALLETGAGSLYVYVRDQGELITFMLDSIASEVPRPGQAGEPRARLIKLLLGYARCLYAYPGAAELALAHPPTGPAFLDLFESALGLLVEAGFTLNRAHHSVDALLLQVTAAISEQDARRRDAPTQSIPSLYAAALDDKDPDRYPLMREARRELVETAGEQKFAWTIRAFLDGLAAAAEPPRGRAPKKENI